MGSVPLHMKGGALKHASTHTVQYRRLSSISSVSLLPVRRFPAVLLQLQHRCLRFGRPANNQSHCQSPPLRRPSLPREQLATQRIAGPALTTRCGSVAAEPPLEPRSSMTVKKHWVSHCPIPHGHQSHWPAVAVASAPAGSLPFVDDRAQAGTAGANKQELEVRWR